jgi:hypothetical protein
VTQPSQGIPEETVFVLIGKQALEIQVLRGQLEQLQQENNRLLESLPPTHVFKDGDKLPSGIMKWASANDENKPCADCKDTVVTPPDALEGAVLPLRAVPTTGVNPTTSDLVQQ